MLKVNDLKNLKDIATYRKDKTHIKLDYNYNIEKALNSNVRE